MGELTVLGRSTFVFNIRVFILKKMLKKMSAVGRTTSVTLQMGTIRGRVDGTIARPEGLSGDNLINQDFKKA